MEAIRVHLAEDCHATSHRFAAEQAVRPDLRAAVQDPGRSVQVWVLQRRLDALRPFAWGQPGAESEPAKPDAAGFLVYPRESA